MSLTLNPITGKFDVVQGLSTLDARYVNVTGDTMTGGLLVDTDIAYDLGDATKYWKDIYAQKVYFNTDTYIGGNWPWGNIFSIEVPVDGNIFLGGTTGDYLVFNTGGSPHSFYSSHNVFTLGRPSNYWAAIYSQNLFLNATAFLTGATAGVVKLDGNLLVEPSTDSTSAVNITKADTTTVLNVDTTNGRVGIGTAAPTNILSLNGNAARIFWLQRHTTADTAGNILTITAGGATAAATDKAGGALILQGGLSTGTGESGVTIQGCVAGATGTVDGTQTTAIQILGNKIGFYAVTPVVRAAALTTQLTTVTCSAPGTPDYAIADLTATSPYGFVSADEGQSVLKVIANLQTRVAELETKLQAYGLLS